MRRRILWVDDEIEFLRAHIMFLETRGYSVTPVFSGEEAIEIVKRKPGEYDLVLLDEQMPGKDGLATFEEIKDLVPQLPVVIVAKNEDTRINEDYGGKKIDGQISKPIDSSRILAVCKKIIHSKKILSSQISQKFVRAYSQYRTLLQKNLSAAEWARLYEELVSWDLRLINVDNEGVRQIHTGQKSDADALFSNFYMENYLRWVHGADDSPLMTPSVLENSVFPRMQKGEKVILLAFDSMRLDQLRGMEGMLGKYFEISRTNYYSILPTSPAYTSYSLFSGMYPGEIAELYPTLWKEQGNYNKNELIERMLKENLRKKGIEPDDLGLVTGISNQTDGKELANALDIVCNSKLSSITVDLFDILAADAKTGSLICEEADSDESSFVTATALWFKKSSLFQFLKDLSSMDCTIIVTSCNGSVLCTRGTELYGTVAGEEKGRYRFGEKVTSDERYAFYISDPVMFKLPVLSPQNVCVFLKENYYFTHHDKFENYQKHYQNCFQYGGISMEEVIVPLATLRPLKK